MSSGEFRFRVRRENLCPHLLDSLPTVPRSAAKEGDIADGSLAEAERSTGLIAKMDYALKRFLWL